MHKEIFQSILEKIEKHRIHSLPEITDSIHPYYQGFSIANLPSSISRWLGIPDIGYSPLDPLISNHFQNEYQNVIFLLVDGLGLNLFEHLFEMSSKSNHALINNQGSLFPLTSITPSTTSAALTTLWTGRLPAEHAYIGYELFLKEYGLIANMITHHVATIIEDPVNIKRAGFDPGSFLDVPTLGAHFRKNKIRPVSFQHESIYSSGLSEMLLNNVERIPYLDIEDLWDAFRNILDKYRNEKAYLYIYWSGLDTASHLEGPESEAIFAKLKEFILSLERFLEKLMRNGKNDTLFILTADHGQIGTDIVADYELKNHPDLLKNLIMQPTGESRMPFLFIKKKSEDRVRDYLESHWNNQFLLINSNEVLESGLLGKGEIHPSTRDRFGSHIVFPLENAYWWWPKKENHLLGRHGGLSREEMLVPLYILEI